VARGSNPSESATSLGLALALSSGSQYGLATAEFPGSFIGHDDQLPGFNNFAGYQAQNDTTIVVITNVYSAPDGSQPANELTKTIIKELSSTSGEETTGESTDR
jgi:D-alanyl-D-alanine carboxypeptidase